MHGNMFSANVSCCWYALTQSHNILQQWQAPGISKNPRHGVPQNFVPCRSVLGVDRHPSCTFFGPNSHMQSFMDRNINKQIDRNIYINTLIKKSIYCHYCLKLLEYTANIHAHAHCIFYFLVICRQSESDDNPILT